MTEPSKDPEKKIIVDEDWKSQVEAEKQAAQQEPEPAEQPEAAGEELPPPTLSVLASSLYLQGLISLGLMPAPGADKPEVHLTHAKHAIDTLQMLQEKTQGNRTPEEDKEMEEMLHQMRMAFLSVQQGSAAGKQ
ncbi:MAG TPA: DUF1844 domain-containing protein [Thermoguttaceae bacterium]|nr:DUF1844 domain-containing protein [Thermoguttaceae bacterium]